MKFDRVINSVPMTIGGNDHGYWVVRTADKFPCKKCAFGKENTPCPTLFMENPETENNNEINPKDLERVANLCNCFGDTASVYFVKVEDEEVI